MVEKNSYQRIYQNKLNVSVKLVEYFASKVLGWLYIAVSYNHGTTKCFLFKGATKKSSIVLFTVKCLNQHKLDKSNRVMNSSS